MPHIHTRRCVYCVQLAAFGDLLKNKTYHFAITPTRFHRFDLWCIGAVINGIVSAWIGATCVSLTIVRFLCIAHYSSWLNRLCDLFFYPFDVPVQKRQRRECFRHIHKWFTAIWFICIDRHSIWWKLISCTGKYLPKNVSQAMKTAQNANGQIICIQPTRIECFAELFDCRQKRDDFKMLHSIWLHCIEGETGSNVFCL